MIVKVGDLTFGWGADVRSMPENDAYGTFVMPPEVEKGLAEAIIDAGWLPSWRREATERVVYRCDTVACWRQAISTKSAKGQSLQVVEAP